jgi:DNA-binding transcriptional LysR family regulator
MEFRELKTFQAVASLLSFNKAADILNYAQSTVSSQIQSLENSLGAELFYRHGNKIAITPAGERLLDFTQRLLNIEKEILSNFKTLNDKHGSLTIKTPQSVTSYYFPLLFKEFQLLFPKIGFDIDWCTSYNLSDIFNSGLIDLAFLITDGFKDNTLECEPLADIKLVLAAHPENELQKRKNISLFDLNNQTLIFSKSDCNYKKILQKMIIEANVVPKNVIEINSMEAIKQLLILGNGIALVPEMTIKTELETGVLKAFNWKGPAFNAKLLMIWHKEKRQSEPLKAFIYMTRKMVMQ